MIRYCHCFSASILSKLWLSPSHFFGISLLGTRWPLEITTFIPGKNQRERWPEPTFIPFQVQKNNSSEKDSVSRIYLLLPMPYLPQAASDPLVDAQKTGKPIKFNLSFKGDGQRKRRLEIDVNWYTNSYFIVTSLLVEISVPFIGNFFCYRGLER